MSQRISIVIPTYKHGRMLAEAIKSVLDQDYPAKEIIVVNDGSPDNTRDIAAAFSNSIVYIEQENKGVSGARNTGIRAAHGHYIALLDGDDLLLPGSLSKRVSFLNTHPDTAIVCGDALMLGEEGVIGRLSTRAGKPKHPNNFRWDTVEYCPLPSTSMFRRVCFEKVGLFDENIKGAGSEDWLLFIQMSLYFNMAFIDEPLALWRVQGQNTSLNIELLKANNRYAIAQVVAAPYFNQYPAHFRAKLLYFRFATAWRVEPKTVALSYFLRALRTDPTQLLYGLRVIRQGLSNTLRRYLQRPLSP